MQLVNYFKTICKISSSSDASLSVAIFFENIALKIIEMDEIGNVPFRIDSSVVVSTFLLFQTKCHDGNIWQGVCQFVSIIHIN